MDRALREFRIRGVKTNIPFLENVIHHPTFRTGQATTTLIDTTPELFEFKPRRDRATKLLNFLGDVIVNGNPHAKGYKPRGRARRRAAPALRSQAGAAARHAAAAARTRAEEIRRVDAASRSGCSSPTPRSATRISRSWPRACARYDMLAIADAVARRTPELFSPGDVGRRDLRHRDALPARRSVAAPARCCARRVPNICFQMLLRGANAVGYTSYPDNVVAGFVKHAAASGHGHLPHLRFAQLPAEPEGRDGSGAGHARASAKRRICYTGDILDPKRDKYSLKYYVKLAKELEKMGAHILASRTWPASAGPTPRSTLVKALKEEIGIPIHFHTHDTSGINAGVDPAAPATPAWMSSTSRSPR